MIFFLENLTHNDERGSFSEVVKSNTKGQFSYSLTNKGVIRGEHFHTRKIERFMVISGKAEINLRRINHNTVKKYLLDGSKPSYVDIPVWSTHNIKNIGNNDLVTLFWINEYYDDQNPDTYHELVEKNKMKKFKLLTVIGTRPEIIRLSRILNKINSIEIFDHVVVHTGQNYDYELNEVFFKDLDLKKPDYFLDAAEKNGTQTAGRILINIDPIFEKEKPDALLVLGDTNSCLCAIAAKKRQIPIFHMEAGNRCFDLRVPEETNRKIVDHISDINLTYSDISREYLIREGISPQFIIKTGSPMKEVLDYNLDKIKKSNILKKLNLKKSKYFLVSAHREENISSHNFQKL